MLHFRQKVLLLFQNQICYHEDCALLIALIVALSICRFYMTFFWLFLWRLFSMQVKLVSPLGN